jgi:hypothetical protein
MLTDKELQFLRYWEVARERNSTFWGKLSNGFPMAIMFCLPILLFMVVVKMFFPEWYSKISNIRSTSSFLIVMLAVFIAMIFFAYFRMQFKWEMNEQLYRELKNKETESV